jgi:hypothetical protein
MAKTYFRQFPSYTRVKFWNFTDGNIVPYANQVFDNVDIAYGGILKRWNGSVWVKAKLMRYNGSSFIAATLKVYKAGSFQLVDTTGV